MVNFNAKLQGLVIFKGYVRGRKLISKLIPVGKPHFFLSLGMKRKGEKKKPFPLKREP